MVGNARICGQLAICDRDQHAVSTYILPWECPVLFTIRSQYINEFIEFCPNLVKYTTDERVFLLSLLDPFSPLVPAEVKEAWTEDDQVYKTSRNFFYDLHKKREKLDEKTEKVTRLIS
jgi:hypothetical protein